jgi:hypothetical protein
MIGHRGGWLRLRENDEARSVLAGAHLVFKPGDLLQVDLLQRTGRVGSKQVFGFFATFFVVIKTA